MKKSKVRAPSGKIYIHKKRERTAAALCANCKSPLHGMPKLSQSRLKKLSASDRKPERPYGGYLCSNCSREVFRETARRM